jgi:hypothetical protein
VNTLTRKRTVYERYEAREDHNVAKFWYDDMGTGRRIKLSWQDYVDMGEPEHIIVSVEPGNRLS